MAHVHARGLVLRMDPDELRKQAATSSCAEDDAVYAQHYFLCIDSDASGGLWVPLFTGARVGTRELPRSAQTGDPRWMGMSAHYDPAQVWKATHKAVQRAATAANDRSSAKLPNRVKLEAVPETAQFALGGLQK
jgi:hypothetical protein